MAPTDPSADMLAHLREMEIIIERYGSPFTGRLIGRCADDFEAGGPVAELLGDWPGRARVDAVGVRLTGALHHAALCDPDGLLARAYPEQRRNWNLDQVWEIARDHLVEHRSEVADFLRYVPQTNEVRRAIVLLTGFLTVMQKYDVAFDMLELGASAGLNLSWDRLDYRTASWSYGTDGAATIDTEWHGRPPPLEVVPRVRSRAACDLHPLDVRDQAQRRRLRAYVWADQLERLARFDAAAALTAASGIEVQRADAAEWLRAQLQARRPGAGTIVYHSVFLQYPPQETRAEIAALIEEAGRAATPEQPLAWVRYEPESLLGVTADRDRFLLDVTCFPGGQRQVLAETDGHAMRVRMLD